MYSVPGFPSCRPCSKTTGSTTPLEKGPGPSNIIFGEDWGCLWKNRWWWPFGIWFTCSQEGSHLSWPCLEALLFSGGQDPCHPEPLYLQSWVHSLCLLSVYQQGIWLQTSAREVGKNDSDLHGQRDYITGICWRGTDPTSQRILECISLTHFFIRGDPWI